MPSRSRGGAMVLRRLPCLDALLAAEGCVDTYVSTRVFLLARDFWCGYRHYMKATRVRARLIVGLVAAMTLVPFSPAVASDSPTIATASANSAPGVLAAGGAVSVPAASHASDAEGVASGTDVTTQALPFLVVKCLTGLGLKGPEIIRIISSGSPGAVSAGLGRAIVACLAMK